MEYLIVPKGTKFMGSGKLGLTAFDSFNFCGSEFHRWGPLVRIAWSEKENTVRFIQVWLFLVN